MTAPPPTLDDLTERELQLVEAARRGSTLECGDVPVHQLPDSFDPARRIRAELIRELAIGRHGELDPRGIQLKGALVLGTLDLSHVTAGVGIRMTECAFDSPIRANGAAIPWLDLSGSQIQFLSAPGLKIEGGLSLDRIRTGQSGQLSTVNLLRASAREVSLDAADLSGHTAPALVADGLRVAGNLSLEGLRATSSSDEGAVRLVGAHVSGQLDLDDAEITNDDGVCLNLSGLDVDGSVFLSVQVVCPESARRGSCGNDHTVALSGFTYGDLSGVEWWEWLHVIRHHTIYYNPRSYQQLASVERAAGHDNNARRILIAQQQDLYARARRELGSWWTQRFHWIWGALAGYGYRARRTAGALLIALVLAGALGLWAGQVGTGNGHHTAERTAAFTADRGQRCTAVELIGVGLDRGLPLSPTGVRARCDINPDADWGGVFTVAIWVVQAAIWGLATLALAGYTALVRKTG